MARDRGRPLLEPTRCAVTAMRRDPWVPSRIAAMPAPMWVAIRARWSQLGIVASSGRARLFGRPGVWPELEQVAGLAIEHPADRLESREADRAGLAGLEDRQVGQRDVDL